MRVKNIVFAGLLIALGVLVPQVFHVVGGPGLGQVFLPMHIPVLIAGFVLSPAIAFVVGAVTPLCSFLYTGGAMPAMPMVYFMSIELGFYALSASVLFRYFKGKIMISLLGAMVMGRLVRGLAFVITTQLLGFALPPVFGVLASFVSGLPGIVIQVILIPPIILLMKKKGWIHYDSQGA